MWRPPFCGGGSKYFGCVEIARPTRKTRCEIRSTTRASPRSAQDDARGRTAYISTAFLSIESPAVFAVLFEAAKAKFLLCSNRVCLAKNATAFFACNTRHGGDMGVLPHARFLGFAQRSSVFWGAPKMNNKPSTVRNFCPHNFNLCKLRLLIRHAFGVPPSPSLFCRIFHKIS